MLLKLRKLEQMVENKEPDGICHCPEPMLDENKTKCTVCGGIKNKRNKK